MEGMSSNQILAAAARVTADPQLSWRAKGVFMAYLLGEGIEKEWLNENGREGRDAINSAFSELRKNQYISVVAKRDPATKQINGMKTVVTMKAFEND